ncbi:hypothetical protein FDECE_13703 [Fusarium decemcellulare]|nr:hypothetical protein FDECE_13703 [Fusarium decemcellulare]
MAPEVQAEELPRAPTTQDALDLKRVDKSKVVEKTDENGADVGKVEKEDGTKSAGIAPETLHELTDIDKLTSFHEAKETREKVSNLATWAQYDAVAKQALDTERGLGQLTMRSKQGILHHTFTTLRIDDLERELRELKRVVYDKDFDAGPLDPNRDNFPVHKHELKASSINEFSLNHDSVLIPTEQQPALETRLQPGFSTNHLTQPPENAIGGLSRRPTGPGGEMSKNVNRIPERLRIRSRSLMSHLEKYTGSSILGIVRLDTLENERVYSAVVFLRPFKFFVKHEAAIRDSLEDVEAEIRAEALRKSKPGSSHHEYNNVKKRYGDKDLLQDLKLLICFLDVDLQPSFSLRKQIKDGTAVRIEYADLWHLFERGDYVVTRSHQSHAYLVVNTAGGRQPLIDKIKRDDEEIPSTPVSDFVVDCLSLGTDGSSYLPKIEKITIKKFHGSQPISSLAVYPLRFDPNADELRARFLKEGKKFVELTRDSFCHKKITGRTLDEPSHDLDAQVIVDMALAMNAKSEWQLQQRLSVDELTVRDKRETCENSWCKHNWGDEGCCGGDVIFKDLEMDDLDAEAFSGKLGRMLGSLRSDDLTEDELMLIRPNLHAFVLRSRQWVTVRTADIHDVVFENSFTDLVLPDNHKTTVQALVRTHENARNRQDASTGNSSIGSALDLVKGKGAGLVILLHGPPGVGKTSTAECVADDTRRPLYPITCGDIGETASEVESNLQYNFQLAHKWGCVLLLDEADIFLARRTRTDLRHNAVTSVFLRSLEYYAGILFLTTNRVGVIDPAFKSRIQMSLFYPKLDLEVTTKLYEKFIKRAREEQDRTGCYLFKIKEKEILRFAAKHFRRLEKSGSETWNGRQIRNAFQTAIALTEHESMNTDPDDLKPSLGKKQFETVADGFRKFDEYLIMATGATESDTAKREGIRNDAFMTAGPFVPMTTLSTPAYGTQAKQAVRSVAYDSESDDDSDSESDSEEEEDEPDWRKGGRKGKSAAASAKKQSDGQANEQEQYQQFLKWQRMQSR